MYSKERGVTPPAVPRPHGTPAYRQPPRERLRVPMNYSGHAIVDGEEQPLGMAISREIEPSAVELPAPGDPPVPRFEGLPRVSELGDGHRYRPPSYAVDTLSSGDPSALLASEGTEGMEDDPLSSTNSHEIPRSPTKSHPTPSTSANLHEIPLSPINRHPTPSTSADLHEIPLSPTNLHPAPLTSQNSPPAPPAATRFPPRLDSILPHGTEDLLIVGLILFLLRESEACSDRGDLEETVILLGLLLLLG